MSDFIRDFKFNDGRDNQDRPFNGKEAPVEFSDCNRDQLQKAFLEIRDTAKCILEIGVCRNGQGSSTYVFLNNKKDETFYIGVDLEDKSFLNDKSKNIFTIKTTSSNFHHILDSTLKKGISQFDFIFIDGYHSINQCLDDWKFVSRLSKNGIVGLHDTSNHPGPVALVENINTDLWSVERLCLDDNGISFFRKK
jgi:hypothetical protein